MTDTVRRSLDLEFAGVGGRTALTRRRYRWPLLVGRVFADSAQPSVGSVTVQNAAGTLIPGDAVAQRIGVRDGGTAIVRGQGATMVAGVPGGDVAVEETEVRVDGTGRLLLDASPRILSPHAHYRQRTQAWVAPGGHAVLVDAVVLHPDLNDGVFGSYESCVEIYAHDGRLLALDAQVLDGMPRVRRAPMAFATVIVIGDDLDIAMTALVPDIEAAAAPVLAGVSDLPNGAGWMVRLAAGDGGALRAALMAATALVPSPRSLLSGSATP
ncbi:urease accessory protein UreD [Mycolicibacterium vaccae]|uniref:urease accessory protein UreD n=1 Tax=Mycolicibacterium vaccae TaxID=1810 RepID=UPI003D08B3A9